MPPRESRRAASRSRERSDREQVNVPLLYVPEDNEEAEEHAMTLGRSLGRSLLRRGGLWDFLRLVRSFWRGLRAGAALPLHFAQMGWELSIEYRVAVAEELEHPHPLARAL